MYSFSKVENILNGDRLQNVPQEKTAGFLSVITQENARLQLSPISDAIVRLETIDGVKLLFASGNAVHYRASGNAPELRCYVEATTQMKRQNY